MVRSAPVAAFPGPGLRRGGAARLVGVLALAWCGAAAGVRPAAGQVAGDPAVRRVVAAYHAGRLEEAAVLLDSVPSSLPAGDAAVLSFYRGLLRFAAGDESGAVASFGRAVELDPRLAPDPGVHSPSRLRAFEAARVRVLGQWRAAADRAEAAGDLLAAQRNWQNVLLAAPTDSVAVGRLAAVHMALAGVERPDPPATGAADSAGSAVSESARAAEVGGDTTAAADSGRAALAAGAGDAAPAVRYNAGRAALLGVLVPGLGELYADRPVRGLLVLGAAAGSVAYGVLSEKVAVRCLSVPSDGVCPPEDVAGEEVRRPYLAPSLGVAAALTVIGAVDAFLAARRANARGARPAGEIDAERGVHLAPPALVPTPQSLRLQLLRFRF